MGYIRISTAFLSLTALGVKVLSGGAQLKLARATLQRSAMRTL
jgi:hypothetical protein